MSKPSLLESDTEVREEYRRLVYGYQMKHVLRYQGTRDPAVHGESDAEHVFAIIFLAQYFRPLEDPEGRLDMARVQQILLWHDFPEIKHGDVPYHTKTETDIERENEAAKGVFDSLPSPLGEEAYALWCEYEECSTPEAKFAYALDKIEPLFELANPIARTSLKRLQFTFEHHIERKRKAMKEFPVMLRFVEVISEDMRQAGAFWSSES